MRKTSYSAIAGALMLAGMAGSANALTFTETSVWSSLAPNAPLTSPLFTTATFSPLYTPSTSGTLLSPPTQRSPYQDNTDGLATSGLYSVLSPGGNDPGGSSATFDVSGVTSLKILWGSPDNYNHVSFLDNTNTPVTFTNVGVGSDLNGSELGCFGGGSCTNLHWVLVTFNWDTPISSLVLSDDGQAAFEFAMQQPGDVIRPTPLPAAVWLFGSVLAGGAGFGHWRKRKAKSATA
jgi:hypothetical protein